MMQEKYLENLRYERKFVIEGLEHKEVEYLVKHNPELFSEIFHGRQVNNIYFDSVEYKNYHDNLSGNAQRIKIRIRWYGKVVGKIKSPVLEIKIKEGHLGRKKSFKLKGFGLDKNFSLEYLHKEVLSKSNLPLEIIEMLKMCKPVLLNSYKRKYFRSANKHIRITLDKDLKFFRVHNKNNNFNESFLDRKNVIFEIKYSPDSQEKVQNLTQHFPFRLSASSKYIYGINLLEL